MIDNDLILLNTKEMLDHIRFDWYFAGKPASWIAIIITTIFVIAGVISIIYGIKEYEENATAFGIVIIGIAIIITIFTLIHEVNKTYPQYQVTITEKTNMKEFYEKYEVVNQDGLIFTIRDKDYKERNYE
jgi:amino acid transporter